MEDLRQLVEICERPISTVSNEIIDSLSLIQIQQLCAVHGVPNDGDEAALRLRVKNFRDKSGEYAATNGKTNGTTNTNINGTTNGVNGGGKPPAFPRTSLVRPPTNLWAATQQPSTNVALSLSTFTAPAPLPPTASTSTSSTSPTPNRAIHQIHLSSIRHNYSIVQSTASLQKCQVIVVVKADGYGHGAILTTVHLVECGVEAFAVATLEEGVALRRAIDEHFCHLYTAVERIRPRVRILVLGAPVGYPACFDTYLHYDIELMLSGPEVAASLQEWRKDHDGRRRAEVLRVAECRKVELMEDEMCGVNPLRNMVVRQGKEEEGETGEVFEEQPFENQSEPMQQRTRESFIDTSEHSENVNSVSPRLLQTKMNAATLTNVTGDDLAREVRQILIGQKHATSVAAKPVKPIITTVTEETFDNMGRSSPLPFNSLHSPIKTSPKPPPNTVNNNPTLFCGIEDAAKASRQKEMRMRRLSSESPGHSRRNSEVDLPLIRKKLRWHALVDSGMGRLGFTTKVDGSRSQSPAESCATNNNNDGDLSISSAVPRDTIEIIQELYDAEVHEGAPIEFYGMCTHMADANDKSTYTHDQMERFRSLIYRVRAAGIAIPTISTDNSAALLTPSLTHFDPDAILSHDTRGFVRTGGAIYGQRPAFKQLRAVSTLVATVSNVAVIHKGESVGYNRAYVATENVRIATLTIGFADGYPRELGNGVGRVSIREHTFPVAGNVCMDMLMVELGPEDDRGPGSLVTVGDTAVLWGPEKVQNGQVVGEGLVPLAELAGILKTTQSALTCGLDKIRVQRQLVD